jgi:penicillin-binding protein 2
MDMMPGGATGGRRDAWSKRVLALTVVAASAFVVLLGQLWYLQVLEGSRFRDMSEKNRIRIRPVAAPRGILFDRNGLALVDNRPAFTLSLIPREMEDRNTVLARLAVMLKIPLIELQESLARVPADSLRPVRIRRDLSLEDVAKVEESKLDLPGVVVEVEPTRVYPTSTFAAHLLGYVREVSDEQLKAGRYRRGDMIGQTGLERLLDEHLRGRDGGERIEVDALGRPVQLMQREEPRPGAQVITTVDRRIQEAAERAMAGRPGAVVVMDPRTGDVLALTSGPAYGLDTFAGNLDREAWTRLIKDPAHPLLNRALQAQYPPGSVFKMIVVAAGLQEGTLNPMDRVYCNGTFDYGGRTWKDWKTGGHGHLDLRGAVMQSCDIFFYQYSLKVGPEAISRYAKAFGLGAATGIDLPGEKFGLVPSPSGRRERGRVWHSGETLNIAIGQGALLVTPLQVARMTSAIANGGILWKPRLIQRVERPDGTLAYAESSKMSDHVDLSPVIWAFLRSAMAGVVNEGGTGTAARLNGLEIAGKTGTAQTIANSKSEKGQDHAWFASFAPAKDPQVVVVVMVEGGGHGGSVAAPIARQIYQAIFLEKVAMAVVAGSGS